MLAKKIHHGPCTGLEDEPTEKMGRSTSQGPGVVRKLQNAPAPRKLPLRDCAIQAFLPPGLTNSAAGTSLRPYKRSSPTKMRFDEGSSCPTVDDVHPA